MKTKTIDEINEVYDLELEKVVGTIKKNKAKKKAKDVLDFL